MPLEAPPGALSHFLLAGCLWFSTSSLLLWLWLLLAFARPLLPLLPLISYTTCPLPLCVVIAPFFLAFISCPVLEIRALFVGLRFSRALFETSGGYIEMTLHTDFDDLNRRK